MARFVEDLSLVLPIIAGEDGFDPNIVTMSLGDPQGVTLKNLRVVFYSGNGIVSPTSDTQAAVQAAATALSNAGMVVEEERPKSLDHSRTISTSAPSSQNLSIVSYLVTYIQMGWPIAVVRGGTSSDGLPIGVQVVAREWREDVVLAVAQQIETALGRWQRPSLFA